MESKVASRYLSTLYTGSTIEIWGIGLPFSLQR